MITVANLKRGVIKSASIRFSAASCVANFVREIQVECLPARIGFF